MNLVYIIGTYPSLTTTFIDREILALRAAGVNLQVVALRRPTQPVSPEQEVLRQVVTYVLPVSVGALIRGHVYFALRQPGQYWGAFLYLITRPHPSLKARWRTALHFGEGVYAAFMLRTQPISHLHAHFVDRAATVAWIVGRLLHRPYSVTAHANDIYVNPILLPDKLAGATFVATCTGYNQAHLSQLAQGRFKDKIKCIYHGLDVQHYNPGPPPTGPRPLILAVGQLKEKKGFTHLLEACRRLHDRGYVFDCHIVGEGPLRAMLEAQCRRLGLDQIVTLCGALPHPQVIEKYRRATVFVLPAVVGEDGDRDGIPNVILEAMAMQLPVVSTRHSGIPEAVEENASGKLIPPGEVEALAQAVAAVLDNPERRQQWGGRGRQIILEKFSATQNAQRLLAEFATHVS